MIKSKTFCVLPWVHFATKTTGEVRPCCISTINFRKNSESLKCGTDTIEEIWNSNHMKSIRMKMINGEKIKGCETCYKYEKLNKISKRTSENKQWIDDSILNDVEYSRNNNGKSANKPKYFNLRLGNICNLKCRMCGPENSSQIYKENAELNSILNKENKSLLNINRLFNIDDWYINKDFLNDLDSYIPYIEKIRFAGGEPTLGDQYYDFVDNIIKNGYNDKIKLTYSINLTNIQQKFIDNINKFKRVSISCSIDGFGRLDDYIRSPSKWSVIKRNFINLLQNTGNNVNINVTFTVQALNILHISELYNWICDLSVKYDKPIYFYFNPLFNPVFLSVNILPMHLKEKALNNLKQMNNIKLYSNSEFVSIKNLLQKNEPDDIMQLQRNFVQYTKILDKHRNENILEVVPELKELF